MDNAGVVTGLVLREARLLFEDRDGVPSPRQLMGSGKSDDPCPSDNDVAPHSPMSTSGCPDLAACALSLSKRPSTGRRPELVERLRAHTLLVWRSSPLESDARSKQTARYSGESVREEGWK